MRKRIISNISDCIGKTPLVQLVLKKNMSSQIAAKLEFLNPTGSVKDRMVLYIIKDAEKRGLLKPGGLIIESTYGNTGISLASLCAARGYRLILTMPETVSREKKNIFKVYGTEIIETPAGQGMKGALKKVDELKEQYPGAFLIHQFNNPANPEAYSKTAGVEIWEETKGKVDIVVAGIGTGGSITGIARYLKKHKPQVRIIGIEPEGSPVLSQGKTGIHGITGIGPGFVPQVFDRQVVDEIITVSDKDAIDTMKLVARKTGILAGISSGAAAFGALQTAEKMENRRKLIIVIFPDNGEKYFYTRFIE